QNKWLLFTFIVSLILYFLPSPDGLSLSGYRILIIVFIAISLIISEAIPLPGIAFVIITLEVYFGIGDANSIARSFMNDAVFFIMGSLMLAVAIVRQGWDKRIALGIIWLTGNKTHYVAFGFAAISAILASFVGEHTVAAIMLPIALSLIRFTSKDIKKVTRLAAYLLFSIAYGSLIGSVGTPSGGGRNVILIHYWQEFGMPEISYLEWMKFAYPIIFIQIPILSWILWKTFPPEYSKLDTGVRRLKAQVAKSDTITFQKVMALIIFFFVFLGWVIFSESIGLGIIALTGVVLYLITGLVSWDDLHKHVNWGVILLFGATISMGSQINNTGAAIWLANNVIDLGGELMSSFPILTDGIVVLLTTLLANILSSSATVAVLGPITLNLPGDPIHIGLIMAMSSAFGYFTAVAAPACTIIYASGLVKAKDFLKVGWKIGAASIVILIIYANTYWTIIN
ncbi:MAG: DASS family sodium-coupled anion symporter, partial [Candidatus Marinimicrobia bacterium]|nr:DASS family sodium-coupled anion symporter [Candidatus Neomarinimicrobiota bacterium]